MSGKITITVDERDLREIEDRVVAYIGAQIIARAEHTILAHATKIANDHLVATVEERVAEAAREVLEKGWPKVSSWGEPTGETWTLRGHIVDLLQREEGGYGRRMTIVDRMVRQAIEKTLTAEFADVLKAAKERFKAAVDDEIMSRLHKTLKQALGL